MEITVVEVEMTAEQDVCLEDKSRADLLDDAVLSLVLRLERAAEFVFKFFNFFTSPAVF